MSSSDEGAGQSTDAAAQSTDDAPQAEERKGKTRPKRKCTMKSDSRGSKSKAPRPGRKRRKAPLSKKSLERIISLKPVPYSKIDVPGPSGLHIPTTASTSPDRSSDVSSVSSGESLPINPYLPVLKPRRTTHRGQRTTADRKHSVKLRKAIFKTLSDTSIVPQLESGLLHVEDKQDQEYEGKTEVDNSPECKSQQAVYPTGSSPKSTSVQMETPSPSSIGFSTVGISTTSAVTLSQESAGSTNSAMDTLGIRRLEMTTSESFDTSAKSPEGPDSPIQSLGIIGMEISSPGSVHASAKSPEGPGSPMSVQIPDTSSMEIVTSDSFDTPTKSSERSGGKETGGSDIEYNPSQSAYHPIASATWSRSVSIPYSALAKTMSCIEQETSRLKIAEILANFFRSAIILSPDDLAPSVCLCLNRLAPAYEDLELGMAETSLMNAIAECTGRSVSQIRADTAVHGDLGIVAERSREKQNIMFKRNDLTVSVVFNRLVEIAKLSGKASMKQKKAKVINLFVSCRGIEARYLIRSLLGKLRIGLAEQTVLQALAIACTKTPVQQDYPPKTLDLSKTLREDYKVLLERNALLIKTAFCEYPDYGHMIQVLLQDGLDGLPKRCRLTPGIPLKPMLAQPTKGIKEIFERFENCTFTCEWKYDGERAQIHMAENGEINIYSRNQENNTAKYPDIISIMKNVVKMPVTSFVLDCEAVAWDLERQQILPFQILSTRKRKITRASDVKVKVCIFAFDLLLLNGEPLIKKPLSERRTLLKETFTPIQGEFQFAVCMDTNEMDEVQSFLDEAVKGKCEGLMVKTLERDATYEIAKRSRNWLKLKKDYLDGMGDSIDVVVIGGYKGQGKRAGLYGGFLLACYDPNAEEFQTLCKIGTGFSDDEFANFTEFFKNHIIPQPRPYYRYDKSHTPDDWFDAVQVWEIKGADLTYSPTHWAAKGLCGSDQRGISLRFPRFLRIRDDKAVTDATSSEQIAEMYVSQAQIESSSSTQRNVEDDFY